MPEPVVALSPASKPAPMTADPSLLGGAVGIGFVSVLLPGLALFFGLDYLDAHPAVGRPIMALFGIMILVGTLALTSTLFSRLGLARRSEPLAMPPGSVRATIALALIVLFAIIVSAQERPSGPAYELRGLTAEAKTEIAKEGKLQVLSILKEPCARRPDAPAPAPAPAVKPGPRDLPAVAVAAQSTTERAACAAADERYTLLIQPGPSAASAELAKQLQSQIIQLLSTVVAFYFATRAVTKGSDAAAPKPNAGGAVNGGGAGGDPQAPTPQVPTPQAPTPPAPVDAHADHVDGCNVPITNPTLDHELPAARGGVLQK